MLILVRKCGEAFVLAEANIIITILEVHGDRVRIGVEAPPEVTIYRHEVWERIQNQGKDGEIKRAPPPESAATAAALP
jgi:carbon storage regulator